MSRGPVSAAAPYRVSCPNCNALNEIEDTNLLEHALCDRCGEPLLDPRIVELTPKRYHQHIGQADLPAVVLFWSPDQYEQYHGADAFAAAAEHLYREARFCRVNVAEYPLLAQLAHAAHAPAVLIFRHGTEVARLTAELPLQELVHWIRQHLSADTRLVGSLLDFIHSGERP